MMRLKQFIVFNGILFAALGIAFAVYGPNMLNFFNVAELNMDSTAYWYMASIARLFGGGMVGWGLVLWSFSRSIDVLPAFNRRSLLFAMTLSCLMIFIIAITQQSSVWLNTAGWVLTGLFGALTLVYGYFTFSKNE
jgi:hypothetical protein